MKHNHSLFRHSDPESSRIAAEHLDSVIGMWLVINDVRQQPDSTAREAAKRTVPYYDSPSSESVKEETLRRRVHECKGAIIFEELPLRLCNASGNNSPVHSYRLIEGLSTDEINNRIHVYREAQKEKEKELRKRRKFYTKQGRVREHKIVEEIEKWIKDDELTSSTKRILLSLKSHIELEMV